jgi:4'-phosphopantetheinyl transferase
MLVYLLEQRQADLPADNDWLSAAESDRLRSLRFEKRRGDWRLGRWTAKRAIAACLDWPTYSRVLAKIEIHANASGAPEAFIPNQWATVEISLSHRAGIAICTVAPYGVKLGCDVEMIEQRSDAFVADYFTPQEQSLVSQSTVFERPALVTLLWSAKESALKALHEGLRIDTRSMIVSPDVGAPDMCGWSPLHVCYVDGPSFHGWWRTTERMIYTVVASPRPDCPTLLSEDEGLRQAEPRIALSKRNAFENGSFLNAS